MRAATIGDQSTAKGNLNIVETEIYGPRQTSKRGYMARPDRAANTRTAVASRHFEGTNITFFDGHAKWYKTARILNPKSITATQTAMGNNDSKSFLISARLVSFGMPTRPAHKLILVLILLANWQWPKLH